MANTRRKTDQQRNEKFFLFYLKDDDSALGSFGDALINMLLIGCTLDFSVCFGCLTFLNFSADLFSSFYCQFSNKVSLSTML